MNNDKTIDAIVQVIGKVEGNFTSRHIAEETYKVIKRMEIDPLISDLQAARIGFKEIARWPDSGRASLVSRRLLISLDKYDGMGR